VRGKGGYVGADGVPRLNVLDLQVLRHDSSISSCLHAALLVLLVLLFCMLLVLLFCMLLVLLFLCCWSSSSCAVGPPLLVLLVLLFLCCWSSSSACYWHYILQATQAPSTTGTTRNKTAWQCSVGNVHGNVLWENCTAMFCGLETFNGTLIFMSAPSSVSNFPSVYSQHQPRSRLAWASRHIPRVAMPDSIVQAFLSSHLRFEMGFPEDSELSLFQWAKGPTRHTH